MTGWRAALSAHAGPLLPAAERFLEAHPGAPRTASRGVEGLAALARAIDAWAERADASSADDELFVEGAGALLALILIDHLGRGAHVTDGEAHRLRVGAHGFFDPFAAIDRALEGDGARAVLVQEVARAEAEAAGSEGVGRAMRLLVARIGEARIAHAFGPRLVLEDGVEVDLGPLLRATEGEGEAAAAQAVAKLASMLPGSESAALRTPWSEAGPRLLPRLTRPGFAAERDAGLLGRALLGGTLELGLVVAYEGRSRFVREDELTHWELSIDEAIATAVANLAARSARARFERTETPAGALIVARTGDGLDGARLLLPTLHDVLRPELGSPFLCATPHRDALYACAAGDPPLEDALRRRAADDAARAPHPTSAAVYLVDARGPRPAV